MIDLVIVGNPFPYMASSMPISATKFVEPFKQDTGQGTWGYNKALNDGARKGKADIIGFCNNDLMFRPRAVGKLVKALETYDSVSPWCPKTHKDWWKSRPQKDIEGYRVGFHVAGWCIFTRREIWEKIGGFDERLSFWCCDNAYAEQLKKAGLSHALIPDAEVEHRQSQTLNKLSKEEHRQLTFGQVKVYEQIYGKLKWR